MDSQKEFGNHNPTLIKDIELEIKKKIITLKETKNQRQSSVDKVEMGE